jgi:hypothetical protein
VRSPRCSKHRSARGPRDSVLFSPDATLEK